MSTAFILLGIIYIAFCIGLIALILMQKKRTSGMGSIAGLSGETYWDKNKGRTLEGRLEKYTKIGGGVLFVFTILMCIV